MSKYVRKTTRQSWSEESMNGAINEVMEGGMGYLKASRAFGIPQSTLEDRVKKVRSGKSVEDASQKGLGRCQPVFSAALEDELVSHVLTLENRLFGLTLTDLRALAFELAENNKLPRTFNMEKRKAGKAWLYAFLSRHSRLRLRTPEAKSIGRAIDFNRPAVEKFFTLLTEVCEKYKFPPDCIWNVDETGITTVPTRQSKVIGLRRKRQVGALVSAERGTLFQGDWVTKKEASWSSCFCRKRHSLYT
ncbi:Tc5 transposase DNA-binding domain [Popillia japonica]|uniref:Tc5 transposase DNA-binding domain n=1 Tax=Popillia japonica TaxID=7064 RepID=A0AAW1LAP4_POPJA